jgi:chemotaxis protein histidine kinase CheA
MALNALNWVDRLRPYRRRVRILLMWRYGAMAGVAGALVATLLSLLDWRGALTVYPWQLGACILAGVLMGALYGLLLRVSDAAVAQLIDRRAGLKDRLQTAMEHTDGAHLFDPPLIEDAQNALQNADPKRILRLQFGKWQKLFVGAVALTLFVQFLPQILAIALPERREEQKEIKQAAQEIQEVAKPILEEAKKPDADELTKRIAQNVELYNKRAREAKMSKQEALLRYNEILDEARKLEQQTQRQLEQAAQKAQTAAEQMQKLAEKSNQQNQLPPQLQQQMQSLQQQLQQQMQSLQQQLQSGKDLQGRPLTAQQRADLQQQLQRMQATLQAMQNPNQANLQAQMNDLQRKIDELQKMLQSGKDANGNPLTKEQMEQLKKQLESLQQQMRALKLSQEAQEFLRKLMNDPAYKEAMEHLRKLAEQMQKLNQQQDPQQRKLTQEEIEQRLQELQRQLEELAKKYNSDEKIRELAQQLLEQVKQMKELSQCQGACMGLGMGNCFGLGMGLGAGGAFGTKQKQAWDKGEFVGQPEMFNQGDKQPELKIPMKDTAISGQPPLVPGAGDYMDYEAPPTPGGSSIPLTQALPTYQKKAEQALSQQNVPPAERKRVKRYFESLQSGK